MIFVTLGSQKFQFNRLLKKIDELILEGIITEPVFAQIGSSDYEPRHFKYKSFLDREEFAREMERSNIVITHGGTGAIIGAVKKRKKVVAVPRLSQYGEHVDDHQLQLLEQFDGMNLICACYDCEQLKDAVEEIEKTEYEHYDSNTSNIIKSINEYLEELR